MLVNIILALNRQPCHICLLTLFVKLSLGDNDDSRFEVATSSAEIRITYLPTYLPTNIPSILLCETFFFFCNGLCRVMDPGDGNVIRCP
ncbi:hypothetical protein F4809DRAFT_343505 [Biscogniauxia mediterranea]|nr:hypothetical protein F4809DRAFT_343505 [Biscogniauxia mediterranea]